MPRRNDWRRVLWYDRRMELRVLNYFLAAARCGSITKAAESLNVTQPTMSRQLKDLEWELGETLFRRTNYAIRLTAAGELLRERAEDILAIADKTVRDFKSLKSGEIAGDISVACAESQNISFLAACIRAVRTAHPNIRCHLYAGDSERALEKLDKGLIDFAVIVEHADVATYNCLTVPGADEWGVVMRRDSPLAQKAAVTKDDLLALPLIASRQALRADLPQWFGDDSGRLSVAATLDLSYNGSRLVREGVGYLLTFGGIIGEDETLCFRPLSPPLTTAMHVIWRRAQHLAPAAQALLDEIRRRVVS